MSDPSILAKVPPNSKELEMMVLGCMLTRTNSFNVAADALNEIDFYYLEHKVIFRSLKQAYRTEKPVDIHLIAEDLKRQDQLQLIGGPPYLLSLAQYAGTSAFIEEYVELVKNKSILRRIIQTAHEVEAEAFREPENVREALDDAQKKFFCISREANSLSGILVGDLLSGTHAPTKLPYLKELQERQEAFRKYGKAHVGITGIPTHFVDLDKLINGFSPSNLMILAARPGMGKTALAMNIAENVCFKNDLPVGIFSLEMSADQLLHRLVSSHAEVESEKIRLGSLSGIEYQKVVSSVHLMQQRKMIIDDQPGLRITDLRAHARRIKEVHGIQLLVIDYLQLIFGSGSMRSTENRQNEIAEISLLLKNLARELQIPILCLSQLSRKVEERTTHRPMLSDLRESGSIEQDSDVVLFLTRRDYYDEYDKPGLAELIIAKNRHGPVGTVLLTYRKEILQFTNYTSLAPIREENANEEAFTGFSPPKH